MDERANCSQA